MEPTLTQTEKEMIASWACAMFDMAKKDLNSGNKKLSPNWIAQCEKLANDMESLADKFRPYYEEGKYN